MVESIIGLAPFVFVCSAFLSLLAGIDADRDDTAKTISRVSFAVAIISIVIAFGTLIYDYNNPPTKYEYTVRAWYLDGGSRILKYESTTGPYIESYHGSYWLNSGSCDGIEPGVVRFDIVSKRKKP